MSAGSPPTIALSVAMHAIVEATSLAEYCGRALRSWAAAPATWGHAIEVPERVAVAVSEETPAPRMDEPGARMSTHGPWLEKEERRS